MSVYNAQPDSRPEWGPTPFPAIPCDIFDANGVNVGPVIACDTESGDLLKHVCDENGLIVIVGDRPATQRIRAVPPLNIIARKT